MLVVSIGVLVGCTSCARDESVPVDTELDALPYLQQTHHRELRAELSRLVAEKATPRLLGAARAGGATITEQAEQLVRDLEKVYPLQKVRLTCASIELVYPQGEFSWGPIEFEKACRIRQRHARQLNLYRRLLGQPDFQFHVALNQGLLADLSLLDHAELAHRLEALDAAYALEGGDTSAALEALRRMFLIEVRLTAVPHVAVRSAAAQLRAEAAAVASSLVQHPRYTPELHAALLRTFQQQLEGWPNERQLWIGDRALGIHAYEMVRDGQLMSILTKEEIEELESEGDLRTFDQAVLRSLDDDQWFYLSVMRRVVNACNKPYYQRQGLFEEIEREIEQLRDTPRYPLLAATVLLPNLAAAQEALAIDRARCEIWVLALQAATGNQVELSSPNPATGQPYALVRDNDMIVASGLTAQRDQRPVVRVPMLTP
jgi:hypothetical protein